MLRLMICNKDLQQQICDSMMFSMLLIA